MRRAQVVHGAVLSRLESATRDFFVWLWAVCISTGLLYVRSLVLFVLWGWFRQRLGLPAILFSHAIGLSGLCDILSSSEVTPDVPESLLRLGVALALGFVIHLVMVG